jgi:hypothetical protein
VRFPLPRLPAARPLGSLTGLVLSVGPLGCHRQPEQVPSPTSALRPTQAAPSASAAPSATLDELIAEQRSSSARSYVAPTEAEQAAYTAWIAAAAVAAARATTPPAAAPRGFALRLVGTSTWLLAEDAGTRRGGALVLLRTGAARPLVIEAPHTFFDEGTLEIARAAFDRLAARALVINTMPRSAKDTPQARSEDAQSGESPSDVAHAKYSFFSGAHAALADAEPASATLQLHGFRDERVGLAQVVVSAAGTRADAQAVARALRSALPPESVLVYPNDIRDLGGTRNAQAVLSRGLGTAFLHLELSASLRSRLLEDQALLRRLVDATGVAGPAP